MTTRRAPLTSVLVALLATACVSDDVPDVRPMNAALIGGAGGELELGDARLTIPPGALEEPVLVTASARPGEDTDEARFLSPIFELGPDGLEFAVPATLTIALSEPLDGDEGQVVIAHLAGSGIEPLGTVATDDGFAASLEHLSPYAILSLIPVYLCEEPCGSYYACCPLTDETNACYPLGTTTHCNDCSSCAYPTICCTEFNSDPHTFKCVDVNGNDPKHCGNCGIDCAQYDGRPNCCGGMCVDFKTDEQHCGSCDHPCGSGEECQAGKCVPTCTPCVGYDGTEDCCPVGTVCHTEPIKGGPCL